MARGQGAQLEASGRRVAIGGRILAKRVMGKAAFATVQDMSGRIQLFHAGPARDRQRPDQQQDRGRKHGCGVGLHWRSSVSS